MSRATLTGILKFILFLGIGLLIAWLPLRALSSEDREHIINSFRNANYFWVMVVIIIGIISHMVRTLRWMMLLQTTGGNPSFKNTFLAVMIGYFANLAFPRLGEVTRCGVLLTTDKLPVNRSFGTVISERATDLLTFFLMLIAVITIEYQRLTGYLDARIFPGLKDKLSSPLQHFGFYLWILAAILLFAGVIWFFMQSKPEQPFRYKIKKIIIGFWQGLISVARIRQPWLFVFYSLLIWFCYFLMTWITFRALPETAHLPLLAGFSVLVMGSFGVMATPGGIGLYPVIAMETMYLYGILKPAGMAMGWIIWGSQTAMIILTGIGAMIWLSLIKRRNKTEN
jgi:glycosyltransferase 2 family protein